MIIMHNPRPDQLETLIEASESRSVTWIQFGPHRFYCRSEDADHTKLARMLQIHDYDQGKD